MTRAGLFALTDYFNTLSCSDTTRLFVPPGRLIHNTTTSSKHGPESVNLSPIHANTLPNGELLGVAVAQPLLTRNTFHIRGSRLGRLMTMPTQESVYTYREPIYKNRKSTVSSVCLLL